MHAYHWMAVVAVGFAWGRDREAWQAAGVVGACTISLCYLHCPVQGSLPWPPLVEQLTARLKSVQGESGGPLDIISGSKARMEAK